MEKDVKAQAVTMPCFILSLQQLTLVYMSCRICELASDSSCRLFDSSVVAASICAHT